jgi:hypothetical protein
MSIKKTIFYSGLESIKKLLQNSLQKLVTKSKVKIKVFYFYYCLTNFSFYNFFVGPQPAGEQLNSAAERNRGKSTKKVPYCGVFKHGNTMYFEKGKREFLSSSEINISENIIL